MIAIVLCGGYGTRLYPLTLNQPKALLPIANKPLLNYIIEKINEVGDIKKIIIVSNNKFFKNFKLWLDKYKDSFEKNIKILNDGTNNNEVRSGGIGDLWFAIEKENIRDDVLIVAGDNLFDFSLKPFINFFKQNNNIVNAVYKLGSKKKAKRFGVVELKSKQIVSFEEKPENPKTDIISLALYLYPKFLLNKIKNYLDKNLNSEGLGYLIKYFSKKEKIFGFVVQGRFFDIGVIEDYKKANKIWEDLSK